MPSLKPLTLALSLLPMCLAAQESSTDTSGFHAGQWAVQFGAGFGLANIGILKFSSPRSAWMLRFDVNAEFRSGTSSTDFVGTSDVKDRSVTFATGLGKRFYQAPRHKVRSFQSIGLFGSYADYKQTFTSETFTFTEWRAGVLGELGAGYWVTPNFSLGGSGIMTAGYSDHTTDNSTTRTETNGWFVSGVTVQLIIGLYF